MAKAKTKLAGESVGMVKYGYGQVEGNKLSARYNGAIFAQLPVAKVDALKVLQNGMFVKYDYAKKQVNLTGPGEWMLVFNEVKVYDTGETDADFAMIADNYAASVYNATANGSYGRVIPGVGTIMEYDNVTSMQDKESKELNPYGMMNVKDASSAGYENYPMVPRVLGTRMGDIITTNTVKDATLTVGDTLIVGTATGVLEKKDSPVASEDGIIWQVVKVTTMPDGQPAVKIMRIE